MNRVANVLSGKKIGGTVGVFFLTLLLIGCAPNSLNVPSQQELSGTWVHDEGEGRSTIAFNGAIITLTDIPEELIDATGKYEYQSDSNPLGWSPAISGSGDCSLPKGPAGGAYPIIVCAVADWEFTIYYDSYTQAEPFLILPYGNDAQFQYDFLKE